MQHQILFILYRFVWDLEKFQKKKKKKKKLGFFINVDIGPGSRTYLYLTNTKLSHDLNLK